MMSCALSEPCDNTRGIANFRGKGLTQIPPDILKYDDCTTLDFGFNNFEDLTFIGFLDLPNKDSVTELYMFNNQLKKLSQQFFANWPNNKVLELTNNFINELGTELCSMPKLEELYLNGNNLTHIRKDALKCLPSLKQVVFDFPPSKLSRRIFKGTKLSRIFVNCREVKDWSKMKSIKAARIILTSQETFINSNCETHKVEIKQNVPITTTYPISQKITQEQKVAMTTNIPGDKIKPNQEVPINKNSPRNEEIPKHEVSTTMELPSEKDIKKTETVDGQNTECNVVYFLAGIVPLLIIAVAVYVLYKKKYFSKFAKKVFCRDKEEPDKELEEGLNSNTHGRN